ncbi:hypothetical protein M436DRAFT_64110 [Aureobasidium namibiae CBS 147.97]|uniref:Uncharacterized protein n=1 Tax=Aureobasidium namibiae CBS 147.97 TaxID=1043004 RepID=A0A074WT55_9PEZI
MAHTFNSHREVEEIDLTDDPATRRSQNQPCAQDRPLSRKNKATVCHINGDNSSRAMDQLSVPVDPEDGTCYSNRDDQANSEHAEQDSHPDMDDIGTYEDPDLVNEALENMKKILLDEDTTIKGIETEIDSAQKTIYSLLIKYPVVKTFGRRPEPTPLDICRGSLHELINEMDVLEGIRNSLDSVEKSHQEAKQELDFLKRSVRSLVHFSLFPSPNNTDPSVHPQFRSKTVSAESQQRRIAANENMLDSVKFLKECLNNHARLVEIVLGRPEPLVKQGTELMQALLSEMFGLPGPDVQEHTQDPLPDAMEVSETEAEVEDRLEIELASESESEAESLWEYTQAEDLMDVEASEASESESGEDDSDNISEVFDDYDDNMSECSDYSTTNKNERLLKTEKREKAKQNRDALWRRFGLTVEQVNQGQGDVQQEGRSSIKRQKRSRDAIEEEPIEDNPTTHHQSQALKQTTLNFNKVTKNRRLFSRKELKEQGVFGTEEPEEVEEGVEISKPRGKIAKRMLAYWSRN